MVYNYKKWIKNYIIIEKFNIFFFFLKRKHQPLLHYNVTFNSFFIVVQLYLTTYTYL